MRYPLWAFFFILILPPFTIHALLTGKAELSAAPSAPLAAATVPAYWTHAVTR